MRKGIRVFMDVREVLHSSRSGRHVERRYDGRRRPLRDTWMDEGTPKEAKESGEMLLGQLSRTQEK